MTKIGLDLGYANITLSDSACNIYREPSVALVQRESRSDVSRIVAVGNEALSIDQDSPELKNAILVRPFKNGVLFDHQLTSEIISKAIAAVKAKDKIRCVVGVPSDFLPKQERELYQMLRNAGVDVCVSVARPVAAIIGAGYSPLMSVISVNIGAQSTEIAVINGGKVISLSRDVIGGEDFDRAVKQFVLDQGDVNVSLSVARAIKEKLGAVWKGKPNDSIDIEGTLALTGNRLRMNVTTEDIVGVFEEPLNKLITAVVGAVKKIPAEAVEDVFANGIVLTGGGSMLYGMAMLMEKVLGIPVSQPSDPTDCVAKGLARINALIPAKQKIANKNVTMDLAEIYEESKKQ